MSDMKPMQRLQHLFAVETDEAVQTINQSCLLLEREPTTEQRDGLLANILRHAHSLKGAARALELNEIAAFIHRLENLFEVFKSSNVDPDPAIFDLIYQTLDNISSLSKGSPLNNASIEALLNRLDTAVANMKSPQAALPPKTAESITPREVLPDSPQNTIRISVERLDAIFSQVNELQVSHLNLEHDLRQMRQLLYNAPYAFSGNGELAAVRTQFTDLVSRTEVNYRQLRQVLFRLREDVRQARMLPLDTLFEPLPRIARNLARELGKEVNLHFEGGGIRLDRAVLEQLKSPLQHLLHNSIDHGVEVPESRRAVGKPEMGEIRITAVQQGSTILLEIRDDGAGIDLAQVKKQAINRQIILPEAAEQLDDQDLFWLLFQSGFSMASAVTAVSGRGVGLDVVRQAVESLHGLILVESHPGQGTRFTLSLPLSIATSLCLLVRVDDQVFALPARHVTYLTRVRPEQIQQENGRLFLTSSGETLIPAVSLSESLGLQTHQTTAPVNQTAVLIGSPEKPVALLVDELCEVQEIVIKKLPAPIAGMPNISGASILGTGVVILVLSVTDLIRAASSHR